MVGECSSESEPQMVYLRSWDGQTQQVALPDLRNILTLQWIPSLERLSILYSSGNLGVFSHLHRGPDSAFLPVYGRSGLSVIERNDKGCLATSVIGHVAATVGCLGLVWSVEDALKGDLLPTTIIGIICLVYL